MEDADSDSKPDHADLDDSNDSIPNDKQVMTGCAAVIVQMHVRGGQSQRASTRSIGVVAQWGRRARPADEVVDAAVRALRLWPLLMCYCGHCCWLLRV